MFGHWYNSSIRNYCLLLGELFSHVQVMRKREDKIELIKVPISYASKERFIAKLNSSIPTSSESPSMVKIETILPRLSLNLLDITYTPERATNIRNKRTTSSSGTALISQYNPVPVKFIFEVGIYTRHLDDLFQIIEQILPYFQPHFSTTMTECHGNDIEITRDVNVVFQSLDIDDNPESDHLSRRRIQGNLIFEVNGWIYPPSKELKGQIKTVYIDLFANSKTLGENSAFESIDTQITPLDVEQENWDGGYIQTRTENIPIPTAPDPSKPRSNING